MLDVDEVAPPLICPNCGREIAAPTEIPVGACDRCGTQIDTLVQTTYNRGLAAYRRGFSLLVENSLNKKNRLRRSPQENEAVRQYMQAYSALQEAFKGELAESQRRAGIEMMAEISREFQQKVLVSPLEASYWTALLAELQFQLALIELRKKATLNKANSLVERAAHFKLRLRQRRLERLLRELDRKIQVLEWGIAFADPPRARKNILN